MLDTTTPAVEVKNLSKHYGSVVALDHVDLTIAPGEYFALLGPSGGGKTTLLRTIGGFHKPTTGQVLLHGKDVSHVPPDKRPTSMVFQSYALFPHMTVARNVGYGLTLAKLPKAEIVAKTEAMLAMVGLEGYGERKPHELSGGQQQRVQLARALVLDRDILLLDEPLAALDAQLRKDMCLELKHLQKQVGITFIHVTHNQEEAMTVADRIALIAEGRLVEQGSAQEIYEQPQTRFTAGFIGENNVFMARVTNIDETGVWLSTAVGDVVVSPETPAATIGTEVALSIRSELMQLSLPSEHQLRPGTFFAGTYREKVYLGLTTLHRVTLNDGTDITVRSTAAETRLDEYPAGTPVNVTWSAGAPRLHSA